MPEHEVTWRGRRVSELTKEELLDVIAWAYREIQRLRDRQCYHL